MDRCIASGITDPSLSEASTLALAKLAERGDIAFVTSQKMLAEVLDTKDLKRRAVLGFVFALSDEVRFHTLHYTGASRG